MIAQVHKAWISLHMCGFVFLKTGITLLSACDSFKLHVLELHYLSLIREILEKIKSNPMLHVNPNWIHQETRHISHVCKNHQ